MKKKLNGVPQKEKLENNHIPELFYAEFFFLIRLCFQNMGIFFFKMFVFLKVRSGSKSKSRVKIPFAPVHSIFRIFLV